MTPGRSTPSGFPGMNFPSHYVSINTMTDMQGLSAIKILTHIDSDHITSVLSSHLHHNTFSDRTLTIFID